MSRGKRDGDEFFSPSVWEYILGCARFANRGQATQLVKFSDKYRRKRGDPDLMVILTYADIIFGELFEERFDGTPTDSDLVMLARERLPRWQKVAQLDERAFLNVLRFANHDRSRGLSGSMAAAGLIITIGVLVDEFDSKIVEIETFLRAYLEQNGHIYREHGVL